MRAVSTVNWTALGSSARLRLAATWLLARAWVAGRVRPGTGHWSGYLILALWLLVACAPLPTADPVEQAVATPRPQATFPPTWTAEPATPTATPAPTLSPTPRPTLRPTLDQLGELAAGETQTFSYQPSGKEVVVVLVEPNPALDVDLGAQWSYGGVESPGVGFKLVGIHSEGEPEAFILEADRTVERYDVEVTASETTGGLYRLHVLEPESAPEVLWHASHEIPREGQIQRYEFDSEAGQSLRLWWLHELSFFDTLTLTLTDPAGARVERLESEDGDLRWLDFTPTIGGTYRLEVEGTNVSDSAGEPQVLILLPASPPLPTPTPTPTPLESPTPTPPPATPGPQGQSVDHRGALAAGQRHTFVYRPTGQADVLVLAEPDAALDVQLEADWQTSDTGGSARLHETQPAGGREAFLLEADPAVAAYHVAISAGRGSGTYRLRILELSDPQLLWHQVGEIAPAEAVQRYEFDIEAGQPLGLFWLVDLFGWPTFRLTISDPTGEVVERVETEEPDMLWLDFTPTTSGTHTLQVEGLDVGSAEGEPYTFLLLRAEEIP